MSRSFMNYDPSLMEKVFNRLAVSSREHLRLSKCLFPHVWFRKVQPGASSTDSGKFNREGTLQKVKWNYIAPEKWWLEDKFPFGKGYFQGICWFWGSRILLPLYTLRSHLAPKKIIPKLKNLSFDLQISQRPSIHLYVFWGDANPA